MKLYKVTFAWDRDETVYCTNLAKADSAEAVELYYERKYDYVLNVREVTEWEAKECIMKGMPVVDIPTQKGASA